MQPLQALFDDYASYHRTSGNKAFHRIGIPMIVLSLFGLLARVTIVAPVDAAMLLIAFAAVYYFLLDWRLALPMIAVSIAFYLAGRLLPLTVNLALFILGWVLQFIGHAVYEKRQPAFARNLIHLLIGPLWILNDLLPGRR